MSTAARLREVELSAARDLGRRHIAVALLIALPLAFYISTLGASSAPGVLPFKVIAGTLGMSWAIGSAAMFLLSGARRVDERLVLAGYSPWELLTGRLLLLMGVAVVLVVLFAAVMVTTSPFHAPALLLVALLAVGFLAIPMGLAIASLVPGDLEGTLVLIAVVGIEMTPNLPRWMPSAGAITLAGTAWSGAGAIVVPAVSSALWSVSLLVVAIAAWRRHLPTARPRSDHRGAATQPMV